MDEKIKNALDRILLLTQQDAEFNNELRKRLGMDSAAISYITDTEKIEHIYELCVEKILRQQAENFYEQFHSFPDKYLLIDDYVNMGHAQRRNKFDYYSLCLYEQLERIMNAIFDVDDFLKTINKIWDIEGFCYFDNNNKKRKSFTFGNIIWGNDINDNEKYLTSGKNRAKNKATLTARDKIRIVLFFFNYYAGSNYKKDRFFKKGYDDLCDKYLDIYLCRNTIHRGTEQSEKEKTKVREIHKIFTASYFEFNWLLTQFVWMTKDYKDTIDLIIKKLIQIVSATIIQKLESAAFVKIEDSSKINQIPNKLLNKIKDLNVNDKIRLVIHEDNIIDIIVT